MHDAKCWRKVLTSFLTGQAKIILLLLLLTAIPTLSFADDFIYDKPYGGTAKGRYDDGKVYDKPNGGSAIGRTEDKDGAGYWLLKESEQKEDNKKK